MVSEDLYEKVTGRNLNDKKIIVEKFAQDHRANEKLTGPSIQELRLPLLYSLTHAGFPPES